MKKLDLGQSIQILANVGVIAGIVFLGVEIQQNNDALLVQARLDREDINREAVTRRFENIDLARATVRAQAGEPLTELDEFLLTELNGSVFVDRYLIYQQVQDGLLGPSSIPLEAWRVTQQEQYPLMAESWDYHKRWFPADFIAWYEQNIVHAVAE